jgi:hypothetical protein
MKKLQFRELAISFGLLKVYPAESSVQRFSPPRIEGLGIAVHDEPVSVAHPQALKSWRPRRLNRIRPAALVGYALRHIGLLQFPYRAAEFFVFQKLHSPFQKIFGCP